MSEQYRKVMDFNKQVLGIIPPGRGLLDMDTINLSKTQLVEEALELLDAHEEGDFIGAVDACIDSIFFAMGVLYKMGVTENQFNIIFEVVSNANMSKKIGKARGREDHDALDAAKPDDWVGPEDLIKRILEDED